MAQLPTFLRPQPSDVLAAPISAFESDTLSVLQETAPVTERGVLYIAVSMVLLIILLMFVVTLDREVQSTGGEILPQKGSIFLQPFQQSIVTAILVHKGEFVRKGQVLATLDSTLTQADLNDSLNHTASDEALVARLTAEQQRRSYALDPSSHESAVQFNLWRQRRDQYDQSVENLAAQIREQRSILKKAREDATAYHNRTALAAELEKAQVTLQQKGFGSSSRLVAATDNRVELARMAQASENDVVTAQHTIASLQAQIDAFKGQWFADVGTQLTTAKLALADDNQSKTKYGKVDELNVLRAPEDAMVLDIGQASKASVVNTTTTNTIGSMNRPLFTLTPLSGGLEAEIWVQSMDVGFIRPGDPVKIKIDAFTFTRHGVAKGVVKSVSEGSFSTDNNGLPIAPYYKVRVTLTNTRLRNVPKSFRLVPGMTLEGDVVVGQRTIMAYLVEGALRTGSEAMREPS